jgi:hypothetical protein
MSLLKLFQKKYFKKKILFRDSTTNLKERERDAAGDKIHDQIIES